MISASADVSTRCVDGATFAATVESWEQQVHANDMIVAYDTPECEQRQLESTLGMDPHTLVGPLIVAYKVNPCTGKSEGACACGRTQTWLDVVNTALHVHSAAFLRDVFLGARGHVLVERSTAVHCSNCGARSDPYGYWERTYACKAR
jgi:hypothetical protein